MHRFDGRSVQSRRNGQATEKLEAKSLKQIANPRESLSRRIERTELWTPISHQCRAKQGPRVSMVYTLLNAYCTVGIGTPTDGDRVGCGPQVGYLGFNIPDGTDLPVG